MTAGTAVPAEPPATARTPQVLLAHHLKQLELPTVLREYDKVARECARDGVDHPRPEERCRRRLSGSVALIYLNHNM